MNINQIIVDAINELENSKMCTNRVDSSYACGYNDGVEYAIRRFEEIQEKIKENN